MPAKDPYTQPEPDPNNVEHVEEAKQRRELALKLGLGAAINTANGEAEIFAETWPTNFTKGLAHDDYGIINDPDHYVTYFDKVSSPDYPGDPSVPRVAPFDVPQPTTFRTEPSNGGQWMSRGWESPIAGHQYDLQGSDAAAMGIAPAPRLGSDELAAEMAEVYAMALVRDRPLEELRAGQHESQEIVGALCQMPWFDPAGDPKDVGDTPLSDASKRRRPRDGGPLTPQTLFRGSSEGCAVGPYLSQFLLQGNKSLDKTKTLPENGYILFGAQRIDQRVEPQERDVDYLRAWMEWLDVQDGANTKGEQTFECTRKFITTPRDLATYVHFDALYQAYLNACLMLLGAGAAFDRDLPEPNGTAAAPGTRDAFATYGPPHILTLVTETATRSLKAVRRQKFNIHNRARPEALGGVATLAANGQADKLHEAKKAALAHVEKLRAAKTDDFDLMGAIAAMPSDHQFGGEPGEPPFNIAENLLLPMAFPEGSPMHPAYGAGHATVAGSCVTVLKAFFEMYGANDTAPLGLSETGDGSFAQILVPTASGHALVPSTHADDKTTPLTLQGELNKLAANISIGRNMAGVHYYSDYFDSLRMGERVAVSLLLEQMVTYTEAAKMTFDSFDGDRIVIKGDGLGGAALSIDDEPATIAWWQRHQS